MKYLLGSSILKICLHILKMHDSLGEITDSLAKHKSLVNLFISDYFIKTTHCNLAWIGS